MKKLQTWTYAILLLMMNSTTIAEPVTEAAQDTGSPQPFRVMSFNVRYGQRRRWAEQFGINGGSFCSRRSGRTTRTSLACRKRYCGRPSTCATRWAGYVFYGAGRADGKLAGEMSAIYYRSERFRRIGAGHFWLSEEPDEPGSHGWGRGVSRGWSVGCGLRDKTDNSVIFVAKHALGSSRRQRRGCIRPR